jgi:hypothetical protein
VVFAELRFSPAPLLLINSPLTNPGATMSTYLHYVLLINPNYALEALRAKKHINDSIYGRFVERMHEIGATTELEDIQAKQKALIDKPRENK